MFTPTSLALALFLASATEPPTLRICDRAFDDVVTERLCAAPPIRSLEELQRALGISIVAPTMGNGQAGNASFALLAHSTSTNGRLVSSLNPRAFLFTSPASVAKVRGEPQPNPEFVVLSFVRGAQEVELASRDRTSGELRFFLLRFEQACNDDGCSSFDLFSPAIESNWTSVDVQDDGELVNTVLDCATCHQPGGPGTPKVLRMQELELPWTHFFRGLDSGQSLIDDYRSAHPQSENYAGIPGRKIGHSQPTRMQGLVEHEGFAHQPQIFPGAQLGYDLGKGVLPSDNSVWAALYDSALARFGLPIPAAQARPFDETRLRERARSYREVVSGDAAPSDMPHLGDLLSDTGAWQSGFAPKPGSDGAAVLLQMCKRCHQPLLDPTVSRARFDATRVLDLTAKQKATILERISLPDDSPLKMPPPRFGRLSDVDQAAVRSLLEE